MRSTPWMILLVALLIGVGWTAKALTDQIGEGPERSRRGFRGGRMARFQAGPYLGSVERFADELGLSGQQRAELASMIAETTEEVRHMESDIRRVIDDTRGKVAGLLTEDQKAKLDELQRQKWEEYRRRRIERLMTWLREETPLDEGGLGAAEAILTQYEEGRSEILRQRGGRDREQMAAALKEVTSLRDERLGVLIGSEALERFSEASSDHRGRGDRGKRRGSSWNGRRRPNKQDPQKPENEEGAQ